MTTDLQEIVAQAAEAEAPAQPDPLSAPAPEAEAKPAEESIDFDSIFKGLGSEGEAAAGEKGASGGAETGPRTYSEDEFEGAVSEELKKRDRKRLRDSEVNGLRQALQNNKGQAQTYLQGLGLQPDQIAPILGLLDRQSGHAQQVTQSDTTFAVESAMWSTMADLLPEAEQKSFADRRVERHSKGEENLQAIFKDFNDTVKSVSTKGRFTQAQVNEAKRDAQRDVIKRLVKAGVAIPGFKAPEAGNGTNGSSAANANYTLEQIDKMPMHEWQAIGASDTDGGRERRQKIMDAARTRAGRR